MIIKTINLRLSAESAGKENKNFPLFPQLDADFLFHYLLNGFSFILCQ
jgi:hypothetical protein